MALFLVFAGLYFSMVLGGVDISFQREVQQALTDHLAQVKRKSCCGPRGARDRNGRGRGGGGHQKCGRSWSLSANTKISVSGYFYEGKFLSTLRERREVAIDDRVLACGAIGADSRLTQYFLASLAGVVKS